MTTDHYPHFHEPDPAVLICLGYNGRGVAMAAAMGGEIARRILGAPATELNMPVTDLKEIPFHGLWKTAAAACIIYGRIRDRLGFYQPELKVLGSLASPPGPMALYGEPDQSGQGEIR